MKLTYVSLLTLCSMLAADSGIAQPTTLIVQETNQCLGCPCAVAPPTPDGTILYLLWDLDADGPDPTDSLYGLSAWFCDQQLPCVCSSGPFFLFAGPPNPSFFYVRVQAGECCWTSHVFVLAPGPSQVELDGWACQDILCFSESELPNPPGSVTVSPCVDGDVTVTWTHDGLNASGMNVYLDGELIQSLDEDDVELIWPCPAESAEFCVSAVNNAGESEPSCATYYPFLLRFADGPSGDIQGIRFGGDNFSLEFAHPWVPPLELGVTLYLISADAPDELLCVDSLGWLDGMTCGFPLQFYYDCRVMLEANYQNVVIDRDTTASEFDLVVGAADDPAYVPNRIEMLRAYPNPFNPETRIEFTLDRPSLVTLSVFDIGGREVALLRNKVTDAGTHQVRFDGSAQPSGIYLASLVTSNHIVTTKLLLLK